MLKPTSDWIVTKPLKKKETITESGILIPEPKGPSVVKLVQIISFGPDANKTSVLKKGDIVMVPGKSGVEVEHKDKVYEMAKEQNFLGVME